MVDFIPVLSIFEYKVLCERVTGESGNFVIYYKEFLVYFHKIKKVSDSNDWVTKPAISSSLF